MVSHKHETNRGPYVKSIRRLRGRLIQRWKESNSRLDLISFSHENYKLFEVWDLKYETAC